MLEKNIPLLVLIAVLIFLNLSVMLFAETAFFHNQNCLPRQVFAQAGQAFSTWFGRNAVASPIEKAVEHAERVYR